MNDAILALDLGNSSCTLAWVSGAADDPKGPVEVLARFGRGDDWPESLLALLRTLPEGTVACLASVASAEATAALAEAVARVLGSPPRINPDAGLGLALEDSSTVGVDRLYAARAALAATGCETIVVDAGTALTVDAVRPAPPAVGTSTQEPAQGEFLGGAIAPGPDLLARALADGGARLPQVSPRVGAAALGKDTAEALQAGITVGLEGAARHLVRRVAEEAGFKQPAIFLTGGAREFLRRGLVELEGFPGGLLEDPCLVLRGLASSARSAGGVQG